MLPSLFPLHRGLPCRLSVRAGLDGAGGLGVAACSVKVEALRSSGCVPASVSSTLSAIARGGHPSYKRGHVQDTRYKINLQG